MSALSMRSAPSARRSLSIGWLVFAISAIVLLVWHHMALLGDTFWCLAAGDRVLTTGALPTRDPFTFTAADRPWMLHMPAFQIGGAWVMRHLGPFALLAAGTAVYSAAHLLVWLQYARTMAARILTFPLVLLVIQVESPDICVRGQVLGDLCFAFLLVLLFRLRRRARVAFYLPLLLGALWVNGHPSFLLGALLPLAAAVVELADPHDERGDPIAYLRATGLFVLGTAINPYSLALVVDVVKLAGNPTTANVDLFNSPNFQDPWWAAFLVVTLAFLGIRALLGGRNARSEILITVAFFAATCRARRFGSFLGAFEIAVAARLGTERLTSLEDRFAAKVEAAISVFALAGIVMFVREPKLPFRDVPVAAARAVRDLDLRGHVVNFYPWGGYLDWAWEGSPTIAFDGRNQLFDDGTFDDMGKVATLQDGWGSILDMYEAETILWEAGAPLDSALAQVPEWQEVHRDPLAVVYRRRH